MSARYAVALALTVGAVWAMSCGGPIHPSGRISAPQEHKTAPSTVPCGDDGPASTCAIDADCPPGSDCLCNASIGGAGAGGGPATCLPSNCRSDADCQPGFLCALSSNGGCGPVYGYFCHTSSDECGIDYDCVGDLVIPTCVFSQSRGHWICAEFDKSLCGY